MEVARGNWVGYGTVFYNEKLGLHSTSIEDVIDYSNLEIDMKGLSSYLDYGYCVFGLTPVKYVKYLQPNESLHKTEGKIQVFSNVDTVINKIGYRTQEDDVLHLIEDALAKWTSSIDGNILIPTSGGFDSRLLNVLIKDKQRIKAYTYGTSFNQNYSREVVYAQQLSQRLGTSWQRVDLKSFNNYIGEWYTLFGPSLAASGTYHMEFYKKIAEIEKFQHLSLLSGIVGDAWAGAVAVPHISNVASYSKLGYTHGMTANSMLATGVDYKDVVEPIFERQRQLLDLPEFRIITAMRNKMLLLQYLIRVPSLYGFEGFSPFIEENIALAMLNLPLERRVNRQWQRDFFKKNNVLFEEEKHQYTYQNSLNYYALLSSSLEPLNVSLLKEVISLKYLEWINFRVGNIGGKERIFQSLMHTPKIKEVLKKVGFKNGLLEAYFAYITIKPIEILLSKRNAS
ncbi:hypothetical protein [Sphingobacterium sp. LRF_L2]|uniref:hypothetical protein n=1 Tax=Sphingobacterium sp. LRF_L2 TaxID=3369421 RepID=UPI003F5E2807